MSGSTENTFGNIQMEERYKKLERTLKLVLLQQNQKKTSEANNLEPTWPSVSSIHGDNLDISSGFSPHSSRIGSEVLASSRNMRKVIQSRSNLPVNLPKMTTSSVKQFPQSSNQEERVLMPPPKNIGILAHSSRRNSLVNAGNLKFNSPSSAAGTDREYAAQSVISSIKYSSSGNNTSQVEFDRENYENHDHSNVQEKPDRIFSRWRPVLNDKGQLIIKGTLECGKIARSKPVIQRLSATSVQSIFKHIYHLNGNICDERHELPDYIRGKFFNGFPDDWENVYQIWSNYVAGGCSEHYRWPTPVTDSDDDLKSEITDMSVVRKPRKRSQHSDTENKNYSMSPREQLNSSANQERQYRVPERSFENRKPSPQKHFNSSITPKQITPDKNASMHHQETKVNSNHNKSCCCCGKETNAQNFNSHRENDTIENLMDKIKNQQLNCSTLSSTPSTISRITSLKDIIYEDKLKIIIDNLTSKKCSIEYIDKIIEMFDCLKYAVSYQSEDCPPSPLEVAQESSKSSCNRQEHSKRNQSPTRSEQILNRSPQTHETCTMQKQASVRKKLSKNDYDSSEDENPHEKRRNKLPVRPLKEKPLTELRSTESKPCDNASVITENDNNYHIPTKKPHSTDNVYKNPKEISNVVNYDSSISFTEDERRPVKTSSHSLKSKKRNDNYDSSVSITEDENTENACKRIESKKSIVQNANAKVLKTANVNIPKRTYEDDLDSNNLVDPLDKMESTEVPLNDNSRDIPKNTSEEIRPKTLDNATSEKNKKHNNKPTIVNIEKVSINIPNLRKKPNSPNRPSPDSLDNHNKAILPEVMEKNLRVELQDIAKDKTSKKIVKDTKNDEANEKGDYGTQSNPKSLSNWVPKLLKKPGENNYGLIFEGKLVNEAGHVVTRKFSTNYVVKRISPRIIETEDNMFYQLVGDLSDTKHAVPKDIQKLCLKGCPGRINSFCEKWKKIIDQTSPEKNQNLNSTTIDMIDVPTSSRGRRILPPLSYWTGERVTLKDYTPVYSPGHNQEASIPSSLEMSFRKDTSQNSSRKKDTSAKDTSATSVTNLSTVKKNEKREESIPNAKKSPVKSAESIKKTRRSTSLKRRLRKELKDDSSDAEEIPKESRVKRRRRKAEDKSPVKGIEEQKDDIIKDKQDKPRMGSRAKQTELTATYRTNVPYRDECALSDDQSSIMT